MWRPYVINNCVFYLDSRCRGKTLNHFLCNFVYKNLCNDRRVYNFVSKQFHVNVIFFPINLYLNWTFCVCLYLMRNLPCVCLFMMEFPRFQHPFTALCAGPQQVGKTWFLKNLLRFRSEMFNSYQIKWLGFMVFIRNFSMKFMT